MLQGQLGLSQGLRNRCQCPLCSPQTGRHRRAQPGPSATRTVWRTDLDGRQELARCPSWPPTRARRQGQSWQSCAPGQEWTGAGGVATAGPLPGRAAVGGAQADETRAGRPRGALRRTSRAWGALHSAHGGTLSVLLSPARRSGVCTGGALLPARRRVWWAGWGVGGSCAGARVQRWACAGSRTRHCLWLKRLQHGPSATCAGLRQACQPAPTPDGSESWGSGLCWVCPAPGAPCPVPVPAGAAWVWGRLRRGWDVWLQRPWGCWHGLPAAPRV